MPNSLIKDKEARETYITNVESLHNGTNVERKL